MRGWVEKIRVGKEEKKVMVNYVPGHNGFLGNKIADKYAKMAAKLPNNPIQVPIYPWDIVVEGEGVGVSTQNMGER